MCTASWIRSSDGFELFFNRDEQRTRAEALPPRILELDGTRVLLPLDGQDHGTWICANEHGLVLCLLNRYEVDYVPAEPRSRGLLVMECAHARLAEDVARGIEHTDLRPLRPFTLVAFDPHSTPILARWDGERVEVVRGEAVAPPLISSGYLLDEVRDARLATWRELVEAAPSTDALARFHASRSPEPGHLAVSMSRSDACTVSCVRIRVTADEVAMDYQVGAPADGGPVTTQRMPRTGATPS